MCKNKNLKKDKYFSLLASYLQPTQFNQTQWVCVIISRSKRKLALSNFTPFRTKDASIKNGSTYFMRPYQGSLNKNDFGSQYLEDENRLFVPKEGKLLIWPSYLLHGSHPYSGEKDRTIISINSSIILI